MFYIWFWLWKCGVHLGILQWLDVWSFSLNLLNSSCPLSARGCGNLVSFGYFTVSLFSFLVLKMFRVNGVTWQYEVFRLSWMYRGIMEFVQSMYLSKTGIRKNMLFDFDALANCGRLVEDSGLTILRSLNPLCKLFRTKGKLLSNMAKFLYDCRGVDYLSHWSASDVSGAVVYGMGLSTHRLLWYNGVDSLHYVQCIQFSLEGFKW